MKGGDVADEPSQGELYRMQIAHEQRTDHIHASLDDRITRLAAETVPLGTWQQAERARDQQMQRLEQDHQADMQRREREHDEDLRKLRDDVIKPLDDRVKAIEGRPQLTLMNKLTVLGVIAAFLGVVVAAVAAAKGGG